MPVYLYPLLYFQGARTFFFLRRLSKYFSPLDNLGSRRYKDVSRKVFSLGGDGAAGKQKAEFKVSTGGEAADSIEAATGMDALSGEFTGTRFPKTTRRLFKWVW